MRKYLPVSAVCFLMFLPGSGSAANAVARPCAVVLEGLGTPPLSDTLGKEGISAKKASLEERALLKKHLENSGVLVFTHSKETGTSPQL